jgi:TusA-related sulfurtransferase
MAMDSIPCDLFVDISGNDCAEPDSRLAEALQALQPGQTLMAVSRKQALLNDIPAICEQRSLQLVDSGETGDQYYYLIRLA